MGAHLFRLKLGRQIIRAAIEGGEFGVVGFGDFDAVLLAQLHYDVEEVHGIEVHLLAKSYIALEAGGVFVRSDFVNDVDDDLFYLVFCHI